MPKAFWTIVLLAGCACAQSSVPDATKNVDMPRSPASNDDLFPQRRPKGEVGMVRGVLERMDPIYDQLVIRPFGGRDMRVGFNPQTNFFPQGANRLSPAIADGSIVSVDTVMNDGRLYALSVRTDTPRLAELHGEVVGVDETRSRLTLRSAGLELVFLRITSGTSVTDQGRVSSVQGLIPGTLVRVWFSAGGDTAHQIEVLAKPGSVFTFEGRIIAVDLRLQVVLLLNATDQSLRELAFASLDGKYLSLLRAGSDAAIEAEFDGDRYNVRSITPLPHTP